MTHAKNNQKSVHALKRKHSDSSAKAKRSSKSRAARSSDASLSKVKTLGNKFRSKSKFHTSAAAQTPGEMQLSLRKLYSFFFFEMSLLLVWVAYRALTNYPVIFDEGIAKALVFGLPVFWFASQSRFISKEMGLDPDKMLPGLYLGIAIGGLYGFAAAISQVTLGRIVTEASLYLTSEFWWLAFLAFLTAWWESLFFFGLPVQYIRSAASWVSDSALGIFVVVLFLLFHAPLRILVTGPNPAFFVQMAILTLFAIGQYVIYSRTKNMYVIILSHLFWGLALEIYG